MADYGGQNISRAFNVPSPYQTEQRRIQQQQKMAEMLQAQSMQPNERFSYNGIEARIPATAGLAKMLQGFTSMMMQKKGLEEEKALGEKYRGEQLADITALGTAINAPATAGSAAIPERAAQPPTTMVDDEGNPMPGVSATPAIAAVPARQAGYIGPEMIAQMKTPEGANQVLALSLAQRQAAIEAERRANEPYTLAEGAGRYQPMPGGIPARLIAGGAVKTPFAPLDVSKFTPESLALAIKPDGTVDRTLLRAIATPRTGQLGVYDEYAKQMKDSGKVPKTIEQFETDQRIAGRTPAAPRERVVYDAQRGGRVNLDTGEFIPVTKGGAEIGTKEKSLPTGEVEKITAIDVSFGNQKRLSDTFKDSYGGSLTKMGGELANIVGGKFGGDYQSQAEWWAAHEANDNVARNALFGASLTVGEQKAWEKTSINPGMSPSMIKNRMTERETLIDAKRNATIGNLDKAGYDVKNFKDKPTFIEKPAGKTTTIAEITNVANETGKTVEQVIKDAVAKGYKVNQ